MPRDQMVKGYEFSKEQYVTFTEEELKAMAEEAQKAIEITEFVPAVRRWTPSTSTAPTTSAPTRAARRPTGCSPRR